MGTTTGDIVMMVACFVLGTLAGIVRQMAGPGELRRKFDGQVVWSGFYSGFSGLSASIPARDYYHLSMATTTVTAVAVALGGVELYNGLLGLITKAATRMIRESIDKGERDGTGLGAGPGDRAAPGRPGGPAERPGGPVA